MTKTEVFCDKCGVKIEADRSLIRLETGPLRLARPEIDLCLGCARALMAWVDEDRDETGDGEVDGEDGKE